MTRCRRCEDIEWLLSWGTPVEEVVRRVFPDSRAQDAVLTLRRHLHSCGRPDLIKKGAR